MEEAKESLDNSSLHPGWQQAAPRTELRGDSHVVLFCLRPVFIPGIMMYPKGNYTGASKRRSFRLLGCRRRSESSSAAESKGAMLPKTNEPWSELLIWGFYRGYIASLVSL